MSAKVTKIIVVAIIATLSIFLLVNLNNNYRAKHEISNYTTHNQILENKYQTLVGEDTAPTYVVDAQGHMDYKSSHAISKLSNFFTDMTTFRTQAQYDHNRAEAKTMTRDRSFLGPHGFEHSMYDRSQTPAEPEITKSGLCEQTGTVHVFEVYPGEYLVIVDYYQAYHQGTLNYIDILTPNHAEFMVNGDAHYFNTIKPITGISMNNNNQNA